MFNRKLLSAFSYVVAVLLALQALYYLVMFVWSYVGTLPDLTVLMQPMEMLAVMGQLIFFYLVVAALRNLCDCGCHMSMGESAKKAFEAPMQAFKRVAKKASKK